MRILDNIGLVQDPIHLGAVILEKLIGDLKSKLPFLSKKKGDDEDLDEEDEGETQTETEVSAEDDDKTSVARSSKNADDIDDNEEEEELADNSLVGKIKAKLSSLKKKKTHDEELEEAIGDDTDAPAKEKKKPNLVVIGGAIALMAFIILSDMGEEEAPAPNPEAMLKKRAQPKKPAEGTPTEAAPTEGTPTEAAPTEGTPTEAAPTEGTPTEAAPTEGTPTEAAPTEGTPTETIPAETAPTETPIEGAGTETIPAEPATTETTPTDSVPTETPPTETVPEDTTVTTAPEETTPTTPVETPDTETTTTPPNDNATVDSINGEETKGAEDNLTEQILKDLENQAQGTEKQKTPVKTEYVTPPNYENVGRGLVYNCAGKHWACIDGPSYKTCEDNASSTKFLNKKSECYPFNVYETQGGCEKMQNRMVSSGAKTEFCSGN